MLRISAVFLLCLAVLVPGLAWAQDSVLIKDDGPPISITSPDTGSTFVYGTLKGRQLYWSKRDKMLMARVTFTDADVLDDNSAQEDTLEFRLPGVTFDQARGIFSATTAKGEVIPIAHIKKTLFIKTIEVLPNAHVRVIHDHDRVTVILEAISPNDPAMHAPAPATDSDSTHSVDVKQLFN